MYSIISILSFFHYLYSYELRKYKSNRIVESYSYIFLEWKVIKKHSFVCIDDSLVNLGQHLSQNFTLHICMHNTRAKWSNECLRVSLFDFHGSYAYSSLSHPS